jgi:hypothetical protein
MNRWLRRRASSFERAKAKRRLAQAMRDEPEELREFVYVNDVALYSLFTSLVGPLVDTFTEAQSESLKVNIEAGADVGNQLLAKGSIRAALETNRLASTQLLRRATVQSNFRSFLGIARSLIQPSRPTPNSTGGHDIGSIETEKLVRGQLLEFEVKLRAQWLFEMIAAVDTMGSLVGITGEELEGVVSPDMLGALRELFIGLVPIEARVIGWKAVTSSGSTARLVTDANVNALGGAQAASAREIRLVGSVSEGLFWRDIRTVLFDDQTFRVLARIRGDGLSESWNSLKLLDVLRSTGVPGLDSEIDKIAEYIRARPSTKRSEPPVNVAAVFAIELSRRHGWEDLDIESIPEMLPMPSDVEGIREWFEPIIEHVAGGRPVDRDVVFDSRAAVLAAQVRSSGDSLNSQLTPTESFLEVEFIAMYW